jgi:SAM-dependent methyltransferase
MKIVGNLDVSPPMGFSGWVADLEHPDESLVVLVVSEGQLVATCVANQPRPDLASVVTNTNKGFSLDLAVTPSTSGSVEARVLPASYFAQHGELFKAVVVPSALETSQTRWRGDEESRGLTWGMMMLGEDFFSQLADACDSHQGLGRLVELGPGYGRLLRHILDRNLKFSSYLGIELSAVRVKKLTEKFGSPKIKFLVADAMKFTYPEGFDTLICSSTIEHLYPDASAALSKVGMAIARGGYVFIDFPRHEGGENFRSHGFTPNDGVFVRYYSRKEVERLYEDAGLRLIAFLPFQMRATDAPTSTNSDVIKEGGWIYQGDRLVGIARFMGVGRKN